MKMQLQEDIFEQELRDYQENDVILLEGDVLTKYNYVLES